MFRANEIQQINPERMSTEMIPSVIDYLLQLPEAMHFAKVHELCSDGISSYRMLSDYGSGTFLLLDFENNFLFSLDAGLWPGYDEGKQGSTPAMKGGI